MFSNRLWLCSVKHPGSKAFTLPFQSLRFFGYKSCNRFRGDGRFESFGKFWFMVKTNKCSKILSSKSHIHDKFTICLFPKTLKDDKSLFATDWRTFETFFSASLKQTQVFTVCDQQVFFKAGSFPWKRERSFSYTRQ